MRITVNSTSLSKALRTAVKVIPSKAANPLMESFRLEAAKNRLIITATNGEITVKVPVKLMSSESEEGSCSVPARRFIEFVNLLPDCDVDISTKDSTMQIKWSKGSTKMQLTDVTMFPSCTEPENISTMDIPAQELLSALVQTIPAAGKDGAKPILNGIHFDLQKDFTRIVGCDTSVLTYDTLQCAAGIDGTFTIPTSAATLLKSAITRDSTIARLTFDDKSACFNLGDVIVLTRVLVGAYPKYMTIIPKSSEMNGSVLASRENLIGTIKRLASCSGKLRMKLSPLYITFSAQDTQSGTSAVEDCDCNYTGDEMEVGINPSKMLSILENITAENVCLELTNPKKPILARDADDISAASLSLCMPVAIA